MLCLLNAAYFSGEMHFNADIHNLLEQHSKGDKSTYAYYHTKYSKRPDDKLYWYTPDWFRKSADHSDGLIYVFGAHRVTEEAVKEVLGRKIE